jgi:hypothetical protein
MSPCLKRVWLLHVHMIPIAERAQLVGSLKFEVRDPELLLIVIIICLGCTVSQAEALWESKSQTAGQAC